MENEILGALWFSVKKHSWIGLNILGIVAIKTRPDGKVKFYIGPAFGDDEDADARYIAENGVPLAPLLVQGWIIGIMERSDTESDTESDTAVKTTIPKRMEGLKP